MNEEIDVLHLVEHFGVSCERHQQARCENDWDSICCLESELAGREHKHHPVDMGHTVLSQQIRLGLHTHVLLQGERWGRLSRTANSTSGLDEMEDFGLEPSQYRQEIAMLEDTRRSGRGRVPRCLIAKKSPGGCTIWDDAGLGIRCGRNDIVAMNLTQRPSA